MITKKQIQFLTSLQIKKYRNEHGFFIAEGEKIAEYLLSSSYKIESIYATSEWFKAHEYKYDSSVNLYEIKANEFERISGLKTPQEVLIVVAIPINQLELNSLKKGLTLIFDEIKDPGNLGTIIRIADWFGIKNVICSPDSVDVYNPKVIQATMGSFCNVKVSYMLLEELFLWNKFLPVYGTTLIGENIYDCDLKKDALIIFGNESRGINHLLNKFISHEIKILSFNDNLLKAESLNISIATGIVCSEFRRRT
jgi:TrmH family RNA methyltransferase